MIRWPACWMRRAVAFLCLGGLLTGGWCATAKGDGGTLRLSESTGGYRIAVFTAPEPLRAGPVEVSVLVQDESSGEPIPDAKVEISVAPRGRPARVTHLSASTETSTNKLFHAAIFTLSEAGRWVIEVDVDGKNGRARSRLEVDAAGPPPRWMALWPWVVWPAPVVLLFAVHQSMASRRRPR